MAASALHLKVWTAYRALAGEPAWRRLTAYEDAVDAARPSTPHWYLGVLATRPDRQGAGLATAVMAPVLARADGEGLDCCLETSTLANKAFYQRRGFTEVTEVHLAPARPPGGCDDHGRHRPDPTPGASTVQRGWPSPGERPPV